MSGSVLDTVNLERRGIPTVAVGLDRLAMTTGMGMARALGYPSLQIAMLPFSIQDWGAAGNDDDREAQAHLAVEQIERILLPLRNVE
jgi:hypothetical protein